MRLTQRVGNNPTASAAMTADATASDPMSSWALILPDGRRSLDWVNASASHPILCQIKPNIGRLLYCWKHSHMMSANCELFTPSPLSRLPLYTHPPWQSSLRMCSTHSGDVIFRSSLAQIFLSIFRHRISLCTLLWRHVTRIRIRPFANWNVTTSTIKTYQVSVLLFHLRCRCVVSKEDIIQNKIQVPLPLHPHLCPSVAYVQMKLPRYLTAGWPGVFLNKYLWHKQDFSPSNFLFAGGFPLKMGYLKAWLASIPPLSNFWTAAVT